MNKKHFGSGAILFTLAILGSAYAGDFVAYEGKNTVQEGEGGTKKTVDGVDFWSDGAPPRKFRLLGFISDTRLKTGLVGKIRMSGLESSIAKQAKEVGGDAVILVDASAETTGYVGNAQATSQASANSSGNTTTARATTWGSSSATAVQKQHTRYAVVKYLPEEKVDDKDEQQDQ